MKKVKRIKIIHILHSVGGVDVSLRLILENLDNTIFENIIIHGNKDTQNIFVDKSQNKLTSFKTSIIREISFFDDILSIFQAYKITKQIKPNVIHAHSAKGGVIGRLIGFLLGIKVLYTPQAFSYLSSEKKISRFLFLLIEKLFASNNNYLLASSISEKNRAISEVGYKKSNVLLFNNSINEINSIEELTIEKTWPDNYICTVGRPSYQKNIELMIRVLKEVNKNLDTHLVIMGVGHHSDKLETVKNLIKELGLEKSITLLEWTNRENVFNIIKHSKVYLSTARYEGLPYSVIEALALSKPCIVSDCDGNRDLIQNNYNGYVIKNEDIYEYSDKIIHLLNDNDLLHKLSDNALICFNQNYNIKKNIQFLEQIYTDYSTK